MLTFIEIFLYEQRQVFTILEIITYGELMTERKKQGKHQQIEIYRDIAEFLLKWNKSRPPAISDFSNHLGYDPRTVKHAINIINYIQSMPKLNVETVTTTKETIFVTRDNNE